MKKVIFFGIVFLTAGVFIFPGRLFAQPVNPGRSLYFSSVQGLSFGAFSIYGNSAGSINVGWDGARTSTGNVALLPVQPAAHPAILEVKLCKGRNVTLSFSRQVLLTSKSGMSLILEPGPTDLGAGNTIFSGNTDCNTPVLVHVGGTLHITGSTTPGTYSGNFEVSFHQE